MGGGEPFPRDYLDKRNQGPGGLGAVASCLSRERRGGNTSKATQRVPARPSPRTTGALSSRQLKGWPGARGAPQVSGRVRTGKESAHLHLAKAHSEQMQIDRVFWHSPKCQLEPICKAPEPGSCCGLDGRCRGRPCCPHATCTPELSPLGRPGLQPGGGPRFPGGPVCHGEWPAVKETPWVGTQDLRGHRKQSRVWASLCAQKAACALSRNL